MAYSSNTELFSDLFYHEKVISKSKKIPKQWLWRLYIICLIPSDILAVGLPFLLAYYVRFDLSIGVFQLEAIPSMDYYRIVAMSFVLLWIVLYISFGMYNRHNLLGGTTEYARVFYATSTGVIIVAFITFLFPDFVLARGWLLLSWLFSSLFTIINRFTFRRIVYFLRTRGYFLSNAVILGANNEGWLLAEQLTSWKTSGLKVIGFVDKKFPSETPFFNHVKVLGSVDQLDEIINKYDVEELILASSSITSRDRMAEIFYRYGISSEVNVRMSSGLYEIICTGLTVKEFGYVPLVEINQARLIGFDKLIKFVLDYCVSIPLMVLSFPLFALIMLAIKLDSPGPVFHRRRVLGRQGRKFDAFKFRTMHTNGDSILASYPELEAELATNHKLRDDPRVTRLGKWLRKYSLDELPQFFNVIKRDMSIVGPRMISPKEINEYDKWYMNLLTVRPGITGYWQVSGRSDVTYEERVRLDMHYIRNWTLWFDLQLIIQTIPAVLRKKGAY